MMTISHNNKLKWSSKIALIIDYQIILFRYWKRQWTHFAQEKSFWLSQVQYTYSVYCNTFLHNVFSTTYFSGYTFGKRNFDEIDRARFSAFAKRNFDELDRARFGAFHKRNFDEIDRAGFGSFHKRNFDELDKNGFGAFNRYF